MSTIKTLLSEKNDRSKGILSGSVLKTIAVISMVIDHVGSHLIRNWFVLSGHNVITEAFGINNLIHFVIDVCDALGSIAFPLFCFLAAEGFYYSRSRGKYALRLLAFALISEIPFNLVHRMRLLYPDLQNVMFTLAISVLTLLIASKTDEKYRETKMEMPARTAVIIFGMGAAFAVRGEYVFLGVLAIALFYYLRDYKYLRLIAFVPLAVPSLWSLLAIPAVILYNGTRGKQNKYFFYVFYPAHFLIIYAIMALWLKITPEFFAVC